MGPDIDSTAQRGPSGPQEAAAAGDPAAEQQSAFKQHWLSLAFSGSQAEAEYCSEQAASRWRVLALVGGFDCAMFVVRAAAKAFGGEPLGSSLLLQLGNMVALYSAMALLNARSRRGGSRAAQQEELLLSGLIAAVISVLLLSLRPGNACDYVYAALFLTCTSSVLRLRWLVGTVALAVPVLLATATNLRLSGAGGEAQAAAAGTCLADLGAGDPAGAACPAAAPGAAVAALGPLEFVAVGPLQLEALVHILVAWAVGALMAYVSDSNRRDSFMNHQLAVGAAAKELGEVQARMLMERELAQAQQQAAARALVVVKEKAANEAKSEFMSLMCHEVRTPLNGCLASAEMLLDTELDEDQRELAKTIRVSGSILLSTVSNFLDFFKIEAGKQLDIVRTPLDLRDLVTDVHCIIEAMVGRERGVVLLPPDFDGAPATVLGDPSRICGILLNLYTNAAKYTKRGSIGLRIRMVRANYRPDPADALAFCEASASSSASGSRSDSRASRSLATSAPDSAPNASGESTPTGVLPGLAGRAAAGGKGGALAGEPRALYGGIEHDSVDSLPAAGKAAGATAAVGAAALLNRQAAAVHSQPDPHFVLRHAPSSQAAILAAAAAAEEAESASVAASSASGADSQQEEPRFLSFEVMDTGVGVSRKALESLFQDYVQGTDSEMQRPRARGGTGLGLSICCKQVAVLGGTIGALSKPACGSVFWFTTPLLLPPQDSSSTESLESEEEAAAAAEAAEAAQVAAEVAAEAAPGLTPSQAAGAAAIRRSLETAGAAAGSSGAATPVTAAASPAKPASEAVGEQDSPLPSGIPTGLGRPQSVESSQWRTGSGSRRHSMESDLSSMWPSHKSPRRTSSGAHDAAEEQADQEAEGRYHPRHALSWEQPAQPPSFTVAEMLSAMPLQAGSAAAVRRLAPTGRPSTSGAVAHVGSGARHQLPPSGAGSGTAAAQREAAARSRQSSGNVLAGLRVLLAEDNLINQTVAKRVLTNLGCDCRVASNGREAVIAVEEAAAAGRQFDVVLMDMCMPVLGGVEATQEIRALGCTLPIVAMTANASERDRVECIAAGMDGFLSKPVLKEQLSVAIREAIQGGHRQ
ncbi:hybrid sensor histidine kinase response regulator [Chlorella sorokiniana]|uniref:histidine kinase n=1 Tax=Chlorella sorokiniana TaxID=3076 RepID=A0A2P6TSN1_CHLSO|nr:hybrid sensor histidine kinase response regulator [Chlorella sorokiniana]|eukprot:PRW57078.1 hybrid sensor histidine kinase response regulator [Chlorella sorokiniana]